MTDRIVTAECWLTLEPMWGRNGSLRTFRVGKLTQSRPSPDRVPVVKLRLRIPERAFAPLAPEVTITVPEEGLTWPEPEVEVVLP